MIRFRAPIRRTGDGRYVIDLADDETALVLRLMEELRELLTAPRSPTDVLLSRLFPVVHPDDPDAEAEYQHLMRDELAQSRLAAIDGVERALASDDPIDEGALIGFTQSINAVRLVLATMLGLTDDEDDLPPAVTERNEYHLYSYLSWVLEWSVRAMTPP